MIANQTERYSIFMNSSRVLSIQQKFRSEISDISRAQCNDPTRPDPTQATARLVIILVSRIQKSVTEDNNFAPNQIFLSDRNEKVRSIWFLTKTSKILGCINGKRPYWIYEPGQRC